MDIASLASSLSSAQLRSGIDIAVAKKSLDIQRQQGAAVVAMLDSARDLSSAKPAGSSGSGVDVYA